MKEGDRTHGYRTRNIWDWKEEERYCSGITTVNKG